MALFEARTESRQGFALAIAETGDAAGECVELRILFPPLGVELERIEHAVEQCFTVEGLFEKLDGARLHGRDGRSSRRHEP